MFVTKQLTSIVGIKYYGSATTVNCLVASILQNIIFCVKKMKETCTGLEQHEGE